MASLSDYNIPAWLRDMAAYIQNPNVYMYGMWDAPDPADVNGPYGPGVPGEGGVDLSAPSGTPVYALGTGTVVGAGYWKDIGHGVITERLNIPGYGLEDLYYQHIILNPSIKVGSQITKGEEIGTVGEYNETEVGLNANWGQPWGTNHPQGWVKDPRPEILALMNKSSSSISTNSSSSNSNTCDPNAPVVGSLCNIGNSLTGLESWLTQAGIVVFGAVIVLVALILVFK